MALTTREIEQFEAVAEDGRRFTIIVAQHFERKPGRDRNRLIPSIQIMETTDGHYVRPTADGRYEVVGQNAIVRREITDPGR